MSKDKNDFADKELRLMEVSEDRTSMFSKESLRDKIVMPPVWDDPAEDEMLHQEHGPLTWH